MGGPQTLPGTPCSPLFQEWPGDETPMLFYHAEVPEIMLEMIHAVLQLGLLHWECQDVVCSLPGTGCSHLFHVRVLRYIHHHAFRDSEATLDKGRFATR